jgi:2-C-methyl-D-erythritol 4-phosphate cytidylyltransferase
MPERCDVIIVAAGSGTRLGFDTPKAFVPLGGKPILRYSFDIFANHRGIGAIVLVVPEKLVTTVRQEFSGSSVAVVAGGAERWESVRNGCAAVTAEWVLVHDAARPFVTAAVIDTLLEKRSGFDCAISATPVVDTIRTFTGDTAGKTINRSKLVRVGTPQLFRLSQLNRGLLLAATMQPSPTDEAMVMQKMRVPVGIAWGDPINFKITTREDLAIAEALISNSR